MLMGETDRCERAHAIASVPQPPFTPLTAAESTCGGDCFGALVGLLLLRPERLTRLRLRQAAASGAASVRMGENTRCAHVRTIGSLP